MKLIKSLKFLTNPLIDAWSMHDFSYQLPKDVFIEYWDEECIKHPTNSHCKIYD